MDDESRRSERPRPWLAWDAYLDESGWPKPPDFWTEEHAAEIRRNHGLEADRRIIPIHEHGATIDEKYRGFDLLIVGSPCRPDGVEELTELGTPQLASTLPTPPGERRVLAVWLARIERPGNPLRIEQRVSLRGDFIHDETVVAGLDQRHTRAEYTALYPGLGLLRLVFRKGGRPPGRTKGSPWDRRQCLEWWRSWTQLEGPPTQKQLANDMGLSMKYPEGAAKRWCSTGLHWPPTDEELDQEGE